MHNAFGVGNGDASRCTRMIFAVGIPLYALQSNGAGTVDSAVQPSPVVQCGQSRSWHSNRFSTNHNVQYSDSERVPSSDTEQSGSF